MVEDFTHVLPEDLPPRKPKPMAIKAYDLDALNRQAKARQEYKNQYEEMTAKVRAEMQAKIAKLKAE